MSWFIDRFFATNKIINALQSELADIKMTLQSQGDRLSEFDSRFMELYSEINKNLRKISYQAENKVRSVDEYCLKDTITPQLNKYFSSLDDPIRYLNMYLAFNDIKARNVAGAVAEFGVWRGYTTKVINRFMIDRKLYLIDTFDGFPESDIAASLCEETASEVKDWFKDGTVEFVNELLDETDYVLVRGEFPSTAHMIPDNEKFAFVSIDFDLYNPILNALNFVYRKVNSGGYIFVHDYNLPVFDYGAKKAVEEFLKINPSVISYQIPDMYGSIVLRV